MTIQDEKLLDEKLGRLHDKLDLVVSIEERVSDLEKAKYIKRGFSIALTFVVTILSIITLFEQLN